MTCAGLQPSSPRLPSSRTPLRLASPGSWAALAPPLARTLPPQPPQRPRLRLPRPLRELSSHEAATALPRAAATTTASSRARSRSRSPVPLPKRAPRRSSSTVSVARGSVAHAESGLVTGLAVKSCPPVPPAQLRLSRVPRAFAAASGTPRPSGEAPEAPAPAQASEASRVPDVASDSDSDWDALLDAHGLPASQCRCSRRHPAGRCRWSWSARSRQAPPSPAQSRQALHVARYLNALAVSRTPRGLRL